jgi:hypothetical protein
MRHLTAIGSGGPRAALAALLTAAAALALAACTGADFHAPGSSSHDSEHDSGDDNHGSGGGIQRVTGSIDIGAGEHAGDVSTVNGSVHIGERAAVGHAEVVNGSITIDPHASVGSAQTVNGSIKVADGVGVTGELETVNGSISLASGTDVKGAVSNVNGAITVAGAHVGGDIHTVAGDIDVGPNGQVDGGIRIERDNSWFHSDSVPRVVIRAGSVVKGPLRFDRKVQLYVSDKATVGAVSGATATAFSGDEPPSS